MIGILAICLFVSQPLAATGNDQGVWFIGDLDPTAIHYDQQTRGLDYAICSRNSDDTYIILQRLAHRPSLVAKHRNKIWFVDNEENGFNLYSLLLPLSPNQKSRKIVLEWTIEAELEATDLLVYQNSITVCCGDVCLALLSFGTNINEIEALCDQPNARVANIGGELLAAVPSENGATIWSLLATEEWIIRDKVEYEGDLVSIFAKDDWPVLVVEHEGRGHVIGIYLGKTIEIASFDIPKGRWSVVRSPYGCTVMGVERNGTTTVLDIGWPSGELDKTSKLRLDNSKIPSIFTRYPFLLPAMLVFFFVFLRMRRSNSKKTKNEGSEG